MKFYKPLFSIIVIFVQLILSLKDHFQFLERKKNNQELFDLISYTVTYDTLFLFVLIIGFYEMLTKPSWFKTAIRIFLVCIVLGTQFSGLIPIDQFYFGVYNTAWFAAVVAFALSLYKIAKNVEEKRNEKNINNN